jgi:hypothetical protein
LSKLTIVLLATALSLPSLSDAATLAAWSQYAGDGKAEARIVTDDAACPALNVDGASLPMAERLNSEGFGRICAAAFPAGAKSASVGGKSLPVPAAKPHHVVVIGDTGCRLKGDIVQACNDAASWPFLSVANHAADEHPDLVIHVGDYLYRETPCKPGDNRCAGTPTGDNWPTWQADFFAPAAKLLASAVWLAERGNHEDCKRAGAGWTAYLGRDPANVRCTAHEKPMFLDIGGIKLAVLDDNDADDKPGVIAAAAASLKSDMAAVAAAKANWVITHHPFHGINKVASGNQAEGGNDTLSEVLTGYDESALTLFLAGHIHNFQIENFAGGIAPQLVVGEGGDLLDTKVPLTLTGLVTGGKEVSSGLSIPGFGYVVLDRIGDSADWEIGVHAADGKLMRRCGLKSRVLSCS